MFIPFHDVVTEVDVRVIRLILVSFNDLFDTVFKLELEYLSILARLGAERLRNWCYTLEKGCSFFLRSSVETSSWAHLVSYPIGTVGTCLCHFLSTAPGTNWTAVWVDPRGVRDAWQWARRQAM